jgi:hypothetical protein
MSFLAPLFFAGLAAIAVPILVHLIQRERKDVIEFPSLMFIRRIPYQSVERRRIHNWLLLLMRVAAMALIIAAFSRPFFRVNPVKAASATTGAREVVILLDRSASMGYGDHWARAQAEARKVIGSLGGADKGTLVLFDSRPEETVRSTPDRSQLERAVNDAKITARSTKYAGALRLAQSLLTRSTLPRKEAVLITDFQKSGWERQEEIHLPEGASITPVSVADMETLNLAVSSIALQRGSFSGQERVTITAGVTNRGSNTVDKLPVKLEIDGRLVDTRDVSVGPNASGSVTFDAVTVAESNMRAVIHAGTDKMPKDNDYYFVLSPSRPVSVLVIQGEGADRGSSLYLTTVLDLGKAPPFKTDVTSVARVTSQMFENRSVVILNDATALGTATTESLKRFVEQGGGLLIALADHTPVSGEWALMPGTLGSTVDRTNLRGGTLGFLDFSHPIFEPFKDQRSGNFANLRIFRYRTLTPAATDKTLARYDDGSSALVERKVGNGRVIAWTTTLDDTWTNAPTSVMYLPVLHEMLRYLAQYQEPVAWHNVGRMLDISAPIGAMVREGNASANAAGAKVAGVVVAPSGDQVALGGNNQSSIELDEQGFYSVRLPGAGDRRPFSVAVNLESGESDLSSLPPAEFVKTATGRPVVTTGGDLEHPEETREDIEKKQAIWWFLLAGGVAALVGESVLSNRLSRNRKLA